MLENNQIAVKQSKCIAIKQVYSSHMLKFKTVKLINDFN